MRVEIRDPRDWPPSRCYKLIPYLARVCTLCSKRSHFDKSAIGDTKEIGLVELNCPHCNKHERLPWPPPENSVIHYGINQCPRCKDGRPLMLDEQQNRLLVIMETLTGLAATSMLMSFVCIDCSWEGVGKVDGEIQA